MLFHRHRVVGAALDGRVIADDHHFTAGDATDAGNHPGAMNIALIHAIGSQRANLQQGRARIKQAFDTFPGQELAARGVLVTRTRRTADRGLGRLHLQLVQQGLHRGGIIAEGLRVGIDGRCQLGHEKPRHVADGSRCLPCLTASRQSPVHPNCPPRASQVRTITNTGPSHASSHRNSLHGPGHELRSPGANSTGH